jgi:hypothetical protein
MFREALLGVAVFAVTAGGAPVPREDQRPPVRLAGTVWEGDGVVAPTVYTFHEDGMMTAAYNGAIHHRCGTWQQSGTRIYWESNGKYCEFEGTLAATTITGKSWNRPGGKWELTVKFRGAAPRE